MAVKDNVSALQFTKNDEISVSGNGTVEGNSIDTAHFEEGVCVFAYCTAYTDGTHNLSFTESDDNVTFTAVPAEKLIGSGSVGAASAEGAALAKVGVFSNARYVKPAVVSTGVTTGATIDIFAVKSAELQPTV